VANVIGAILIIGGMTYAVILYVRGTRTLRRLDREDAEALKELERWRKPGA
jgi:hypothetical protein